MSLPSQPRTGIYLVIIFLTGATTLALELLASRVMTPYFGVSLYIWTGILSITLIALSLGYYIGGRLTASNSDTERMEFLFLLMPALSSLAMSFSCWLYPQMFAELAGYSLVMGSFIACVLLIFLPLIAVSAMNPLLIAIESHSGSQSSAQGDSGSGRVFFISTVGSVVGVSLTAFIFIPNMTNYNSLLLLALALAALSLTGTFMSSGLTQQHRNLIRVSSAIGCLVSSFMLMQAADNLGKNRTITFDGNDWTLQEEYSSLFGNSKVIRITGDWSTPGPDGQEKYVNVFLNDGIAMNSSDHLGRSLSPFTHALEHMSASLKPEAKTALVLGLGAGVVPTRLAAKGIEVDVVEINPDYLEAAIDHFQFDASVANVVEADARTFVRFCSVKYDVVVIDLFQSDGIPDYLLSREFFMDIAGCMQADGVATFNTLGSSQHMGIYYNIVKTLQSVFPEVLMFHGDPVGEDAGLNIYLAASQTPLQWNAKPLAQDITPAIANILKNVFSTNRELDQDKLAQASIITDEFNIFSILNEAPDRIHRRELLSSIPADYLVN